jgi:undecaprenyl-diphosphatase
MKKKFIAAGAFFIAFLLLIIGLKTVGVSAVGPMGTEIGFSRINAAVHGALGVHTVWYEITELLGYVAILVMAAFVAVGLIQLIRRKSFREVDAEIYAVGGLYAVMAALYAFFEIVVINYRCVIMSGATEPEASFPSSHTMLACVVLASAIILVGRYIKKGALRLSLKIACTVLCVAVTVGRLLSGVHWLTDIIGGILISAALVLAFWGVLDLIGKRRSKTNG